MPFASLDFRSRTIASSLDDEINAKVKKWLRWAQFFSHNASNKTLLKLNTRQQDEKWVSGCTHCLDASRLANRAKPAREDGYCASGSPLHCCKVQSDNAQLAPKHP